MEPTATITATSATSLEPESAAVRRRQLAAARRRATALLAGVTVLFIAVTAAGAHGTLLGYVQAGAEASMVGGVAANWSLRSTISAVCGIGRPRGRRNRAVTANQSATPPTMAASAPA